MNPSGGTELLVNNFLKYINPDLLHNSNLIISRCDSAMVSDQKINIIWQHLMHDQPATYNMINSNFVNAIDYFVYVSDWQLSQFKDKFNIDHCKNTVIKNAIEPIQFVDKSSDKIRLIYTSMPNRGLEILLDAFKILNRTDVELHVYSSNIIYGSNYAKSVNYDHLFHRCKTMDNVVYKGYAKNKGVRKALQEAHIFAYPSIFEETSCLAAIEAGAAGCKIVTTAYGALQETCGKYATFVEYSDNKTELVENYAEILNKEIDNYTFVGYNQQSAWFNGNFSWETRIVEWTRFLEGICEKL